VSHSWRALRHRNFKLFFFGQSISAIGNWMTRLAELPKIRTIVRPMYRRMGLLTGPGIT